MEVGCPGFRGDQRKLSDAHPFCLPSTLSPSDSASSPASILSSQLSTGTAIAGVPAEDVDVGPDFPNPRDGLGAEMSSPTVVNTSPAPAGECATGFIGAMSGVYKAGRSPKKRKRAQPEATSSQNRKRFSVSRKCQPFAHPWDRFRTGLFSTRSQ
jgi:hypothetical protein